MITISARDKYIAAHVTRSTKEALQAEAKKRNVPVSQLISDILVEKLRALSYTIWESR